MTLKISTILHATHSMYKRRVLKAERRDREALCDSAGRDTDNRSFRSIRDAEYLKDQPKFRNVGGSGESNYGHRAMDGARKLL